LRRSSSSRWTRSFSSFNCIQIKVSCITVSKWTRPANRRSVWRDQSATKSNHDSTRALDYSVPLVPGLSFDGRCRRKKRPAALKQHCMLRPS
jgi:hypothetical protein